MKKYLKFFGAVLALLLVVILATANLTGPAVFANENKSLEDVLSSKAESTARYFVEYCLAKNGELKECDFYAEEADDFKSFVQVRNDAILKQRAVFDLDILSFSIQLDKTAEVRHGDSVVYYFKSEEGTDYSAPYGGGSTSGCYLVELIKEDDDWKIVTALSSDEIFYRLFTFGEIMEQETNLLQGKYDSASIQQRFANVDVNQMEEQYRQYREKLQTSLQQSEHREEIPTEQSSKQTRGSFNRSAMKQYQRNWAKSRNPKWGDYSPADCQNFASQVIYAGGAPMCGSWYYYSSTNTSLSWINVMSMRSFVINNHGKGPRGQYYSLASSLICGDLVMFDWNGDGTFDHTMVIYNAGSNPTVSGHTTDALNVPLSNYVASNVVYIHLVDYGT